MLKVSGYSDDVVCVAGDVNDEFDAQSGGGTLEVSDGTVLEVDYDADGVWRIIVLFEGRGSNVTVTAAPTGDDDNYSDVAVIDAPVRSVRWTPKRPA